MRQHYGNVQFCLVLFLFSISFAGYGQELSSKEKFRGNVTGKQFNLCKSAALQAEILKDIPSEFHSHPEIGFALGDEPESFEMIHLRDKYAKTFKREGGQFSKISSYAPLHYKNNEGLWLTIDDQATVDRSAGTIKIVNSDLPISWNAKSDRLDFALTEEADIRFSNQKVSLIKEDSTSNFTESNILDRLISVHAFSSNISKIEYGGKHDGTVIDYITGIDKTMDIDFWGAKSSFILKQRLYKFNDAKYLLFEETVRIPDGWTIFNNDIVKKFTGDFPVQLGDLIFLDSNGDAKGTLSAVSCH